MKRAVIDIGTNTAHLLIASVSEDFSRIEEILFKHRVYTYLGSYGLETIHSAPLEKLFDGLREFHQHILSHQCTDVKVIATEAMRTASNGPLIIEKIQRLYGWKPTIIDGITEAIYIVEGARQAVDMSEGDYLVMDIGGGSVEFIYVSDGKTITLLSTPLGISRLFQKYHQVDPILPETIELLEKEVSEQLDSLHVDKSKNITLVGTAGSFEIFMDITDLRDRSTTAKHIEIEKVINLYQQVKGLTIQERQESKFIPPNRTKYIVVALALIMAVIQAAGIKNMIVSKYALKEGAIIS